MPNFSTATDCNEETSVDMIDQQKSPKGSEWGKFVYVFQYALESWRPYWRMGVGVACLLLLDKLFWVYFSYGMKVTIDNMDVEGEPVMNRFLTGLLIIFPLIILVNVFSDHRVVVARVRIANDIRRHIFTHLQRLSMNFYAHSQPGDIVARFAGDLGVVDRTISDRFITSVMSVVAIVLYTVGLFYLSWQLALGTLGILLILIPCIRWIGPRVLKAFHSVQDIDAQIINFVQENVRVQPVVQGFGLQDRVVLIFQNHLERFSSIYTRAFFLNSLVNRTIVLVIIYSVLLAGSGGAWLVHKDLISSGTVIGFLALLIVLSKESGSLGVNMENFFRASAGIRRIEQLVQRDPKIVDSDSAVTPARFSNEICFQGVSFGYVESIPLLSHLTMTIPVGRHVALVGPSGAGKSTLLRLLLRFYDVVHGKVTIDGIDIKELKQASLRSQMGIVFQDALLFDASIRDNICLFDPNVTDRTIETAARAAEIHDFIVGLPAGYHTHVGDAGSRLSGGQRQRITIARALLKNPAILLLDEVTASLDAESAMAINNTIESLSGERTIISVTHNLQQAVKADDIFVLDQGQLVESGTHDSLMTHRGLYHQLWKKQTYVSSAIAVDEHSVNHGV